MSKAFRAATCSAYWEETDPTVKSTPLAEFREHRLLRCPYCEVSVEASNIEAHMGDCDQRPVNCTYCNEEFDSFVYFRDEHLDVCREKHERRYMQGFDYAQVSFKGMEDDVGLASHKSRLKDEIKKLETKVQTLTVENKNLQEKVNILEDTQKAEQYLRMNMADTVKELQEQVDRLHAEALQRQEDLDKRIEQVEFISRASETLLKTLLEKNKLKLK